MFDRPLYQARLWAARQAGSITHAQLVVGLVLSRYAGRKGCCWPSMDTIAAGSGSCTRTVQRAVNRLRDVGLLVWQSEWTTWNRRDSNHYTLLIPDAPAVQKEKSALRIFPASLSYGLPAASAPLSTALTEAFSRLAQAMSVQPGRGAAAAKVGAGPPPSPR